MDGHYPPSLPSLGAYYPSDCPPMMPPEAVQPGLHHSQTFSMESLGTYSDYDDPNRAMHPPPNSQRFRRRHSQSSEHVKHRRTRSGCYTCRQRRVKCDEIHPVCDRCRKGKRECTYPGTVSLSVATNTKASGSASSARVWSPPGSSPSSSDRDFEEKLPLLAIPDEDEDETLENESQSVVSQGRKLSNTPSASPPARHRVPSRPQHPPRSNSKRSIRSDPLHGARWASLSSDVKHYLKYHQESLSHHHYAFKYDGGDFLKTTFLHIALRDKSAALLYAIVAFTAYHHSISRNDDNISLFLSYYNKSIAYLQRSLKSSRHDIATLLTILQLATIEEFLGDWVNLLGHQKAAYQILTDLFTPQTIMQDETSRRLINWYTRFDLFAGLMSGGETTLSREWFVAEADFYKQQTRDRPTDLGARFEEYFATTRLLTADMIVLLGAKTKKTVNDEQFSAGIQKLTAESADFGQVIETAFTDESCFVKLFSGTPSTSGNDLFGYADPNFLYTGELFTMNFVLFDQWAIDLMLKYQVALATGQTFSTELTEIARKKCKMLEAIQYSNEGEPAAILGCQASLGIMTLVLPKDEKHMVWGRQKFAEIERLGYIYPATLRARMSEHWGKDLSHWWLPNNENFPRTIRTIREFVRSRASRPTDAWASPLRDMNGAFRILNIEEQGLSDDVKSARTESSISPWM